MNAGSLFSGAGLLDYGLHLAGFDHRWLCEKDEFRANLLKARFPGVPVYRDVCQVGRGAERVELIAGGFPCKGVSVVGRRDGFDHPETVLWREMLRVVRELRPRYVIVENVANLLVYRPDGGWPGDLFGEVLGGLAESGYDTEWDCFPAAAFGAPHGRDRVFVTAALADTNNGGAHGDEETYAGWGAEHDHVAGGAGEGGVSPAGGQVVADPNRDGLVEQPTLDGANGGVDIEHGDDVDGRDAGVEWGRYRAAVERWEVIVGRAAPQPLVRRVDDGVAGRLDRPRVSALGDGVLVQAGWLIGRRIIEYDTTGAVR